MRKKLIKILLTIITIVAIFISGCTVNVRSITSITKTGSNGIEDIYTIEFSDGTTTEFTVTNGRDGINGVNGENASDITIEDLFERWLVDNPNGNYEDFIKQVFAGNYSDNTRIINKALCSSLKVYSEFAITKNGSKQVTHSAGSAVIYRIDEDYTYIITNYHVVYNQNQNTQNKIARKIVCYLYGSESGPSKTNSHDLEGYNIYDYGNMKIECEYVGGTATADLAIVKAKTQDLKALNPNVKQIEFANDYHVGDTAIAIGNPADEGISATQGIVSIDNEYIELSVDGAVRTYRSIRIDTPLYHGNSGGGLFNAEGKLIGITNAGDVEDQNVNYAIPVQIVKPVVENIMKYNNGSVNKMTIGVTVQETASKFVYDEVTGLGKIVGEISVVEVSSSSIASIMGIKVDDILLSMNVNSTKITLNRFFNIGDLLYSIKEGDEISIELKRNNQTLTTNTYTVKATDIVKID